MDDENDFRSQEEIAADERRANRTLLFLVFTIGPIFIYCLIVLGRS